MTATSNFKSQFKLCAVFSALKSSRLSCSYSDSLVCVQRISGVLSLIHKFFQSLDFLFSRVKLENCQKACPFSVAFYWAISFRSWMLALNSFVFVSFQKRTELASLGKYMTLITTNFEMPWAIHEIAFDKLVKKNAVQKNLKSYFIAHLA